MATKRYNFKFHCLKDKDIIDRIDSQENKQNYIRGLILSDIASDILRDSIKLEDLKESFNSGNTHAVHEPVTHDVESFDLGEKKYHDRVDFYNDNCPALNNLDHSINLCDGCEYKVHFKDVDGIEKAACSLEDAWRKHWSDVLYDAIGGAKRDYPAEFKGLKKGATDNGKLQQS